VAVQARTRFQPWLLATCLSSPPPPLPLPCPEVLPPSIVLAACAAVDAEEAVGAPAPAPLDPPGRAALLASLQRALLLGRELPAAATALPDEEWRAALAETSSFGGGLSPEHLCRLSRELRVAPLAEWLVIHMIPPLASALPPEDDEPLPEPLSDAFCQLLHASGLLRLSAASFDERVVLPLRAAVGGGPRAAAEAALVYVAALSEAASGPEG